MQTTIEELAAAAGRYEGTGDGAESGPFTASIELQPVLDGLGVQIDYEAVAASGTDEDATRLHRERSLLSYDMISGEPTLYVLSDELRGVAALRQSATNRYGNDAGDGGFELQVEIELDGDRLTYAWSWAPPQEELVERTRAVTHRHAEPGRRHVGGT